MRQQRVLLPQLPSSKVDLGMLHTLFSILVYPTFSRAVLTHPAFFFAIQITFTIPAAHTTFTFGAGSVRVRTAGEVFFFHFPFSQCFFCKLPCCCQLLAFSFRNFCLYTAATCFALPQVCAVVTQRFPQSHLHSHLMRRSFPFSSRSLGCCFITTSLPNLCPIKSTFALISSPPYSPSISFMSARLSFTFWRRRLSPSTLTGWHISSTLS